jgi:hypothetical protein
MNFTYNTASLTKANKRCEHEYDVTYVYFTFCVHASLHFLKRRRPYLEWDSSPRFQCMTGRPLLSAGVNLNLIIRYALFLDFAYT